MTKPIATQWPEYHCVSRIDTYPDEWRAFVQNSAGSYAEREFKSRHAAKNWADSRANDLGVTLPVTIRAYESYFGEGQ